MAVNLASTENMPYDEWLGWRKKGIGGSDASVVCGINRYRSPIELWMDKTNQIPYQEAGEAAYWGTQLEALVKCYCSPLLSLPCPRHLPKTAHLFCRIAA